MSENNSSFGKYLLSLFSKSSPSLYGGYLDRIEKKRALLADAIFKRPDSISRILPYEEYLPDHQTFIMKDGSLGRIFEIALVEHETMTLTQIVDLAESLESLLKLPENCVLQIQYLNREISEKNPFWIHLRNGYKRSNPRSREIFETKINSFAKGDLGSHLFERRAILSIRFFPKNLKKDRKIQNALKESKAYLLTEINDFMESLKEFKSLIDNYKMGSKLSLVPIDGQGLVEIARSCLSQSRYNDFNLPPFKANDSISNQIVFSEGHKSYQGIEAEGLYSRTVSLKGLPAKCWPGMMADFTTPSFPFDISINITFPPSEELKKKLNTKLFFLGNAPTANSKRQKEDSLKGLERLEYGDQGVTCTLFGVIYGKTQEEVEDRSRKLANLFQDQFGTAAVPEKTVGFGQIICSLPLTFDHQIQNSMQRQYTMYRRDMVNLLPVFDSFKGTKDHLQLFTSRENSPVLFSPFCNPTSNHSVVIADSGSGKSAFVNDIIQSAKKLNPEPLVFVVDKKTSYLMLNKVFDGDITIFDPNGDMPFSPFRGIYDEVKISFLTNLLLSAIALTSSKFELEGEHHTAIAKSLRIAYNNKYSQKGLSFKNGVLVEEESNEAIFVTIDDVVRELAILKSQPENESSRDQIDELIKKLKPFYGDGPYAKFFAVNESSKKSDSLFYVYDIEGLTDPVLNELISMSIFEEIRMTINRPENEGRMSIIVAEELGQNGDKNPTAAKYWSDFAETMRKKGAWLIGLAPNPRIFFETKVGQAFWGAADNYFFLKLAPDNVQYLQKNSDLVDENIAIILKSLDTVKDSHADIFYTNKNKSVSGVFRFPQTSIDKWLAPTNQKDALKAKKALEKFPGDPGRALKYLVDKYPVNKRKEQ